MDNGRANTTTLPPPEEQRRCRSCEVRKPLSDFPVVSSKSEETIRRGPRCKPCKAKIEAERRLKKRASTKVGSDNQPIVVNFDNPEPALTLQHEGDGVTRSIFNHPEYASWEIEKAVSVFQTLIEWRDRARKNGQIDW